MDTQNRQSDKEYLTGPQRLGEGILLFFMLMLAGFFIYHQTMNTGFFTDEFRSVERVALYGPLLLGLCAPAIRAWMGRRNPARPFEAATSLCLAVGAFWLLTVFPLDYSHLADALPGSFRFILAWVTDDIARVILTLQIIIGPITAVVALWRYYVTLHRDAPATLRQRPL